MHDVHEVSPLDQAAKPFALRRVDLIPRRSVLNVSRCCFFSFLFFRLPAIRHCRRRTHSYQRVFRVKPGRNPECILVFFACCQERPICCLPGSFNFIFPIVFTQRSDVQSGHIFSFSSSSSVFSSKEYFRVNQILACDLVDCNAYTKLITSLEPTPKC